MRTNRNYWSAKLILTDTKQAVTHNELITQMIGRNQTNRDIGKWHGRSSRRQKLTFGDYALYYCELCNGSITYTV